MKPDLKIEIRGYIGESKSISVTCCSNINDVTIGGISLISKLDHHFDLYSIDSYEGRGSKETPLIGVSYLILDEDPGEGDFNDLMTEWTIKLFYSEYISGCYSEYTCGYGGYDYLLGEDGHSLTEELSSHEGKYVFIRINEMRELSIDTILSS